MEIAKEAVALDPTEADHKAALGKAFSALKLRKLATAEFEKAVALTPRKRTPSCCTTAIPQLCLSDASP